MYVCEANFIAKKNAKSIKYDKNMTPLRSVSLANRYFGYIVVTVILTSYAKADGFFSFEFLL